MDGVLTRSEAATRPDPVVEVLDLEVIVSWSERAETLLGWSAGDALGKNVRDLLIAPAERTTYAEWARRARAGALHCPLHETITLSRDGRQVPTLFKLLAKTPSQQGPCYGLSLRVLCDQLPTCQEPFSGIESIRALLDMLPVGIYIADRAGNIIQSNAEAQRIWGGARLVNIPQYVEYKGWWQTGERIQAEGWALARALSKGETSLNEFITIESFDGVRKMIVNAAAPLRNSRNEIIGAVAINHDVTELKQAQESLKQIQQDLERRVRERTLELFKANERLNAEIVERKRIEVAIYNEKEFLTAVLNNMEDGVAACDANGILTVFNRATREFHGQDEAPLTPDQWASYYDLYQADGRTPMKQEELPLFRALQGEIIRNVEFTIKPKNGLARHALTNGQPIFDAQGKKLGAIITLHDITQRRLAEAALRRQQFLLQYIINFVPHAIFWKDREDRFLGGNNTFLHNALGVNSVEEMIGKNDYDFFPRDQAEYFRECDFMVMESEEPMLDIEEPQSQWGRGKRVLLTSKVPLRDETGAVVGLLGSFVDITERTRMEEELKEAKRAAEAAAEAKSAFLTTVSHELRTPLALILGPLTSLLSCGDQLLSPRVQADLERIQRNARRLHRLVNDVLDYQKIEAGKLQLDWEAVDVTELCTDVVSDARLAAEHSGIELSLRAEPDLPTVPLDRRKFEKILLNLVGNALKFTPPGGRVIVGLLAANDHFELSVEDTGPGIPTDKQHLLFQRFQQLDTSPTRKHEGTGIGLSLVKELTEMMGGTVGVTSEAGKGSRFFVRLPRTPDRLVAPQLQRLSKPPSASRAEDRPGDRSGYFLDAEQPTTGIIRAAADQTRPHASRLLVAEDNPDMRAYLAETLAPEYEVELTTNGRDALTAAQARRPDVIISDVMMPEMDGFELVARIKRDPALRNVPIILLTARASRAETVGGLDVGADDYLSKPFDPAELQARVRAAERLHRAYRELAAKNRELEVALWKLSETQEELVQAGKMAAVGTLIAGLSHELNNPIAIILMNAQLLLRRQREGHGSRNEAERGKPLLTIEAQANRCAALVRALLEFSRRKPASQEPCDVRATLDRALEISVPPARERGVQIEPQYHAAALPPVLASPAQLDSAVLNVIGNAIDAVSTGGTIFVGARVLAKRGLMGVEIAVRDTGCGIHSEDLHRIFEPFYTTKAPGRGTGLGLALTRRFLEENRGDIGVESMLGVGTTVFLWLPAPAADAPSLCNGAG